MKRHLIWIIPLISIQLSLVLIFVFVVQKDDMRPPKLPTESTKNTLTITSNGCCFLVENVVVSLLNDEEAILVLATHETVHMNNIFTHNIPVVSDAPLSLLVEFMCYYGDDVEFSMSVKEFTSINKLRQTGVLIYFQEHDDMYLNIIVGNDHKSYKMGNQENRWALMDTPNRVYHQ